MNKNAKNIAAGACRTGVTAIFSLILLGCNFAPSYEQPEGMVPTALRSGAASEPAAEAAEPDLAWVATLDWVQD